MLTILAADAVRREQLRKLFSGAGYACTDLDEVAALNVPPAATLAVVDVSPRTTMTLAVLGSVLQGAPIILVRDANLDGGLADQLTILELAGEERGIPLFSESVRSDRLDDLLQAVETCLRRPAA